MRRLFRLTLAVLTTAAALGGGSGCALPKVLIPVDSAIHPWTPPEGIEPAAAPAPAADSPAPKQ